MHATEPNGCQFTAEAIRRQTDKILASQGFAGSERLSRFLRFAVEAKLRGEDGQLKEYLVGREVFDRDDSYDPRMDPIVRVEARRLRSKLDEYYSGPGRLDPIRIQFPKGSYAPRVGALAGPAPPSGPLPPSAAAHTRRWLAALAGVAAVSSLGTFLLMRSAPSSIRLAVIPARWLRSDGPSSDVNEDALAERIGMDLAAMRFAEVISWPSVQPYRASQRTVREIGAQLGLTHVLIASSRIDGDDLRVVVHLVDPRSDGKAWAAQFRRRAQDAAAAQPDLSRVIAEELRAFFLRP